VPIRSTYDIEAPPPSYGLYPDRRVKRRPNPLLLILATYATWSIVGSFWAMKFFAINVATALLIIVLTAGFGKLSLGGMTSAVLPLLGYCGYLFATSLWALNPEITLFYAAIDSLYVFVFCIAYVVALNRSARDSESLFTSALYICALVAAFHMVYRPFGNMRWGNGIAMVLAAALPFIVGVAIRRGTWRTISSAVLTIVLLAIAQSKTGILATGAVLPVTFLTHVGNVRRAIRVSVMSAIPVCAILVALFSIDSIRVASANTFVRLTGVSLQVGSTDLLAEKEDPNRVFERTQGWEWFWEHMPWGVGHMNYTVLSSARLRYVLAAHNTYLAWGIEGGIPLLLLGGGLLARFAKRTSDLLRNRRLSADERAVVKSCGLSLLALLIFGLAHQIHQYPPLYALLGFMEGLHRRERLQRRAIAAPQFRG
jgi:O-antigen ligase